MVISEKVIMEIKIKICGKISEYIIYCCKKYCSRFLNYQIIWIYFKYKLEAKIVIFLQFCYNNINEGPEGLKQDGKIVNSAKIKLGGKDMSERTEEKIAENIIGGSNTGSVKIANDVVATIAGLAATEIEGIAGMSGGIAGGIAELLGRKNLTKGVKVEVGESEVAIDVYIIVEYGSIIPQVAQKVQDKVKNAVESMTGLKAKFINVHIQGVTFPQGHPANEKTEE